MKKNDIDIDLIQIIEIIKSSKISLIVSIVFTVLIASYYGISRPDPSSLYSSSALIKIGSFQEVENYQIDMWSNKSDKLIMNEKKIESMESTIDYLTSKFILIPSFFSIFLISL